MTPRMLHAVRLEWERECSRRDEMAEFMLAQVAAMIGNTGFARFKEPVKPADLMPSEWRRKRQAKPKRDRRTKRQRAEDLAAKWRQTMESLRASMAGV